MSATVVIAASLKAEDVQRGAAQARGAIAGIGAEAKTQGERMAEGLARGREALDRQRAAAIAAAGAEHDLEAAIARVIAGEATAADRSRVLAAARRESTAASKGEIEARRLLEEAARATAQAEAEAAATIARIHNDLKLKIDQQTMDSTEFAIAQARRRARETAAAIRGSGGSEASQAGALADLSRATALEIQNIQVKREREQVSKREAEATRLQAQADREAAAAAKHLTDQERLATQETKRLEDAHRRAEDAARRHAAEEARPRQQLQQQALMALPGGLGDIGSAFAMGGAAGVGFEVARKVLQGLGNAAREAAQAIRDGATEIHEMEMAGFKLEAAFRGNQEAVRGMLGLVAQLDSSQPFFEDDQLAAGAAQLALFDATETEIGQLLPVLADMAAVMGTDLGDATQKVGLALAGNTRGLKQWGIVVEEGSGRQEILNAVLEKAGRFHAVAEEAAGTLAGKEAALNKEIKNLQASIAEDLMPVMLGWKGLQAELARGASELAENMLRIPGAMPGGITERGPRTVTIDPKAASQPADLQSPEMRAKIGEGLKMLGQLPEPATGGALGPVFTTDEQAIQADLEAQYAASQKAEASRKRSAEEAKAHAKQVAADQVQLQRQLNRSLELADLEGAARERQVALHHHLDRLGQAHGNAALLRESRKQLWFDLRAIDESEGEKAAKETKEQGEKAAKAYVDGLRQQDPAAVVSAVRGRMAELETMGPFPGYDKRNTAAPAGLTAGLRDQLPGLDQDLSEKRTQLARELEQDLATVGTEGAELRRHQAEQELAKQLSILEAGSQAAIDARKLYQAKLTEIDRDGADERIRSAEREAQTIAAVVGSVLGSVLQGNVSGATRELGGIAGAAIGSLGGPIGIAIGTALGGVAGKAVGDLVTPKRDGPEKEFWSAEEKRRESENRRAMEAADAHMESAKQMQDSARAIREADMSLREKLQSRVTELAISQLPPELQQKARNDAELNGFIESATRIYGLNRSEFLGPGKRSVQDVSFSPAFDMNFDIPGVDKLKLPGIRNPLEDVKERAARGQSPEEISKAGRTGVITPGQDPLKPPVATPDTSPPTLPPVLGPQYTAEQIGEIKSLLQQLGALMSNQTKATEAIGNKPLRVDINNPRDLWAAEPRGQRFRSTAPGTSRASATQSISIGGNVNPGSGGAPARTRNSRPSPVGSYG